MVCQQEPKSAPRGLVFAKSNFWRPLAPSRRATGAGRAAWSSALAKGARPVSPVTSTIACHVLRQRARNAGRLPNGRTTPSGVVTISDSVAGPLTLPRRCSAARAFLLSLTCRVNGAGARPRRRGGADRGLREVRPAGHGPRHRERGPHVARGAARQRDSDAVLGRAAKTARWRRHPVERGSRGPGRRRAAPSVVGLDRRRGAAHVGHVALDRELSVAGLDQAVAREIEAARHRPPVGTELQAHRPDEDLGRRRHDEGQGPEEVELDGPCRGSVERRLQGPGGRVRLHLRDIDCGLSQPENVGIDVEALAVGREVDRARAIVDRRPSGR